ncbi:MAG TPA: hypothetical protein DCE41_02795 [Cytophagales bacterium]|nr:hypothetical protein [Cytophagales bacterium]HAA17813.1 hypothetical protein [Cytophagales bacterium]HAP58834.1 hypothetical protein [Cytophagales bacterium]
MLETDPRVASVRINSGLSFTDLPKQKYSWVPLPNEFGRNVKDYSLALNADRTTADLMLTTQEEQVPVRVESKDRSSFSMYEFGNTNVRVSGTQRFTQMGDIGRLVRTFEPETIHKENRQYKVGITFDYTGNRERAIEWAEEQEEKLALELPFGFEFEEVTAPPFSASSDKWVLIIIMVLVIFVICSVLFESLRQPLIILMIIPISFIGLFLTYTLFKVTFGPGGFAALILLGGISVNASIFIINQFNQSSRNNEAVFLAVKAKTKPILLTVFSTCVGFLPYVFFIPATDFWYKFGVGVIGGLVFSLIGIFIYIPAMLMKAPDTEMKTKPATVV